MKDINFFSIKDSIYLKHISNKSQIGKKDKCDGYLIESNEKEARRIIESLKGKNKIIAIVGEDDAFNRRAVETLRIDYLVSPERGKKTDSLKQRDSGINHVVAKEAARNKISFVVNLYELSNLSKEEKSKRLSRIIQNIKICRRAKCQIKIANFSSDRKFLVNEIGRKALGISLGMSSGQAKNCVDFNHRVNLE